MSSFAGDEVAQYKADVRAPETGLGEGRFSRRQHPEPPLERAAKQDFAERVGEARKGAFVGRHGRHDCRIRAFVEFAPDSGVEHVVLLSGRGEDGAERAEAILQASGLEWNIVRASWFRQNFLC